jgi:hypothetical protein
LFYQQGSPIFYFIFVSKQFSAQEGELWNQRSPIVQSRENKMVKFLPIPEAVKSHGIFMGQN